MSPDRFPTLLKVFLRDLVHRRSLWLLAALVAAILLVEYWVAAPGGPGPHAGAQQELARIEAVVKLRSTAFLIRPWAVLAVIVFSALLAPDSRRNGTTAFLLCLGVGRLWLAAAQYTALAIFLSAAALVIHAGYSVAAWPLGEVTLSGALFGWFYLLAPLLCLAAASFSLSLTRGPIETSAIFIVLPLAAFAASAMLGDSGTTASMAASLLDHIRLLFPDPGQLVSSWPRPEVSPGPGDGPTVVSSLLSTAGWTVFGLWLYYRRDLGSRAAMG